VGSSQVQPCHRNEIERKNGRKKKKRKKKKKMKRKRTFSIALSKRLAVVNFEASPGPHRNATGWMITQERMEKRMRAQR